MTLLVGRFLRPHDPHAEKLEVYECGEPTIGSAFVQFDLRFYVIALLFIIFDVEVAFFFPWAAVYGKATHLMDANLAKDEVLVHELPAGSSTDPLEGPAGYVLNPAYANVLSQLGVPGDQLPTAPLATERAAAIAAARLQSGSIRRSANWLALTSMIDILVFFGVLMVGFAYVWRRGDLEWVRAVSHAEPVPQRVPAAAPSSREPALV